MTYEEAVAIDGAARRTAGIATAEEYRELLIVWNHAIAILHGTTFDPSHDRERGRASSG